MYNVMNMLDGGGVQNICIMVQYRYRDMHQETTTCVLLFNLGILATFRLVSTCTFTTVCS